MAIHELSGLESPPKISFPTTLGVFGFGLLASPAIADGKVTLVTTFSNRIDAAFEIDWINSHYFIIEVVDATGHSVSINALFPPPQAAPPPLVVAAGQDYTVVFNIDTSLAPYLGHLDLGPGAAPYRFDFRVNSTNFLGFASLTLPVAVSHRLSQA
jgi:hypothetical protein